MKLDFESAKSIATELDVNQDFPYFTSITALLEHVGQFPNEDLQIYEKLQKSPVNSQLYQTVIEGLYLLYNNPNNSEAFLKLVQALNIAKEKKDKILVLVYLALLELYGQEIVQSSNDYLHYLEEFRTISEEILNQTWYTIHRIRYFSKSSQDDFRNIFLCEFERFKYFFDVNQTEIPENLKGYYYYYLGMYHKNRIEIPKAKSAFKFLLSNYETNLHYQYLVFVSNLFLCEIASENKNYALSKSYLESARKYWNKSDIVRSQYIQRRYSAFYYYEKLGLYKQGFNQLKNSMIDEAQLDFRNNTFLITDAKLKYETAEKEKQILVEQQRATTNRNWLIAASLALLLGSGIAILLQKNTTKKRQLAEQTALLEQQKVETLLKEQELVSIDAMIAGQEKERQKVANELHDDLGSLMATIKLHFDNVKVDKKDPALQSAQALLEKAYQKIRGLAHHKNSGVMSDQGLLPAIKKMARTINETNALEVTVEDFGLGERMENSLELSIFRTLQELVANAIKHAQASKLNIQLTQHQDSLNIIVEDDGQGFDRSQMGKSHSGMGLTNIEKRIEHLGGHFTIDSVLGKGTAILIDIPV